MSRVYLAVARDALEGVRKLVVLKVLHDSLASNDEYIEMFMREAKVAVDLSHPNVVHTYTVGQEDGRYCIVMEYLDGVPLSAVLRRARDWPLRDRLPLLGTLCLMLGGLHYVHEFRDMEGNHLRLVHRDLKPGNILIGFDGQVKLLDFGVVKLSAPEHDQTQSLSVKGTVQYVAPEALDPAKTIDRRYDIFAAGLVLWEILTGRRFWDGREPLQIMRALEQGKMTEVLRDGPSMPAPLRMTLERSLSLDPEDRHASALELRSDIQRYLVAAHFRIDADQLSGMLLRHFGDVRDERRLAVSQMLRKVKEASGPSPASSLSAVPALADQDVESGPSSAGRDVSTHAGDTPSPATQPGNSAEAMSTTPSNSPPESRRRGLIAAAIAVPLLGAAAFAIMNSDDDAPESAPTAQTAPVAQAAPSAGTPAPVAEKPAVAPKPAQTAPDEPAVPVKVTVKVTPKQARIEIDGKAQSRNPASIVDEDPDSEHEVVARADGYATEKLKVRMDQTREISVELQPLETEAEPATGTAPPPRARRRKKGSKGEPEPVADAPAPEPAAVAPAADPQPRGPRPGDDLSTKKRRRPKSDIDSNIPWQ